ncbi:hypothetical protein ACJ72_03085 [Emergomyces africanus]|uniref:Uncharacterized protein n=1 Tax=Emergomyces africanus TaxID=1955775 RepID=A0A1B7P0M0_9EURO|nr:hypothetical protein ACJ72_03085 [Emergomyces africanus]
MKSNEPLHCILRLERLLYWRPELGTTPGHLGEAWEAPSGLHRFESVSILCACSTRISDYDDGDDYDDYDDDDDDDVVDGGGGGSLVTA